MEITVCQLRPHFTLKHYYLLYTLLYTSELLDKKIYFHNMKQRYKT